MESKIDKISPRQVIDKIRLRLLGDEKFEEDAKEVILELQTQLNSSIKLLSEDLYSKKSHFVLELIQNADDNHYAPGVTPHLTLKVQPSCLVVANNEVGFTEENIKAICKVGASSKSKKKAGYIGEKGIGFKSVFTVSDAPEIHSNGFHFKFDRTIEGNLLGYVVPQWCDPTEDVRADCTTIVLPAAKTYQFGPETLVGLDAHLLLFLNKLRQLSLEHDGKRITYKRKDKAELSVLSAALESEEGISSSEEMHYIRSELAIPIEGKFTDEKRPNIESSTVVLAFPIDAVGAAKPEPDSHVFAFLPIRQMGFKFAIQADFILSSSREEVLADRPWNQLLRSSVADVFSNAVETFKKSEPLALSYLRFIPAEGDVVDPFFRVLRKDIIKILADTKSLLSASGDWRTPRELRVAEKDFRALFPSEIVKHLFGFDFVDIRLQGGIELLRSLGAVDAGLAEVLSIFSAHGDWLQKQSLEWRAKFFAYVANNQKSLFAAGLLKSKCLPVSDGTFVVPAQSNVFFPLGKGKKYGFEDELVLIDNELYEEAQKYSEHVVRLFAEMKVRLDEPYDLVNSHILPRHKGNSWKTSDHKAVIGHLRYIKDKLKSYLEFAQTQGKTEAQAYQILRDGIWIGTKKQDGTTWMFSRVENLYLSKEYKPQFCMESNLADALAAEQLVSPGYLAVNRKDPDGERESWRQFFANLGIRLAPAVEADGHNWKCSNELQKLLNSPTTAVRRATLECMSLHWSNYATRLTYTVAIGRTTFAPNDTKFVLSLRATLAPTKNLNKVTLAESYYPTPELKALLGDSLPYVEAELSDAMLDACRVTRRLNAQALVKRLKQLKANDTGTAKQVQEIYRALDERLWVSDSSYIKQAFSADDLIRITGKHKGWFKLGEVSWNSSSTFLDSLYPPLSLQYRDFSKFFVDKLGLHRELSTIKYVDALTRLEEITSPVERKNEALIIYRRANRDLDPKFVKEKDLPDWLETFQTEAVYINQRGEIVHNDDYLFANDNPTIAMLFEDDEDLSFLAVPAWEVPRLNRLLDAAQVRRLSDSITFEVSNADTGVVDEVLTASVRRSVHFFARVLYAKRPEVFDQALKAGRLASLKRIEVAQVPQVDLVVSLGESDRETTADIAQAEERVLYRTGARSVKDILAAELSKYLGAAAELADTFARILMETDVDGVEDFLNVRNIGALPADLLEALEALAVAEGDDEFDEKKSDKSTEEAEGGSTEADPGLADAQGERRSNNPSSDTLEATAAPVEATKTPRPTQDPTLGAPGTSIPRHLAGSPAQPGNSTLAPASGTGGGQAGNMVNPPPVKGAEIEGRKKRGQATPSRTKAGRLLSYAAGPGDTDRSNPDDDPAKVAARVATERAAVEYFMTTQAARWKSLTEMPQNNPGFDVLAIAEDDQEEFIEIKGQSGAWTEEGVALTPHELMTAQQKGEQFWLCIVEFAQDDKRRQLHLVRNPYGMIQQFRFDKGWKSVADSVEMAPLKPDKDMYIDMPGVGRGRIVSVRGKGKFFNLHVLLDDGRQVNKLFNPAKMALTKEPTWQG